MNCMASTLKTQRTLFIHILVHNIYELIYFSWISFIPSFCRYNSDRMEPCADQEKNSRGGGGDSYFSLQGGVRGIYLQSYIDGMSKIVWIELNWTLLLTKNISAMPLEHSDALCSHPAKSARDRISKSEMSLS